ncbi:MAG: 50S ribosomal protein L7Ae [Nanoarchaeota archaeon]|nr:50S ribosomal protein L7Ae [Nanoarchaeota archaeon]MCG2717438.1 50S ribosomal protein L7Ae [Nanoarchaeota archaeon]
MAEVSKEIQDKALEVLEIAKNTGKIKKGVNETTKAIEKGAAKLVLVAKDVNPAEITMHLSPLCKEKNILLVEIASKEELGTAAGLAVSTVAAAVVDEGEGKKILKDIASKLKPEENK